MEPGKKDGKKAGKRSLPFPVHKLLAAPGGGGAYHAHPVIDNISDTIRQFFPPGVVIMHIIGHITGIIVFIDGPVIIIEDRKSVV